ncbi:2Fe-2S iron-sulfur cluster-binding protein [Oceanobacillus sp. M60]
MCGACSIIINGKPKQACSILIDILEHQINLEPMKMISI